MLLDISMGWWYHGTGPMDYCNLRRIRYLNHQLLSFIRYMTSLLPLLITKAKSGHSFFYHAWYTKLYPCTLMLLGFTFTYEAKCKTAVTPLLTHWSYYSLALSHRYFLRVYGPILPRGITWDTGFKGWCDAKNAYWNSNWQSTVSFCRYCHAGFDF